MIPENCEQCNRGYAYSWKDQKMHAVWYNNTIYRHVKNIFNDAFFNNKRLKNCDIDKIGYMWLSETPYNMMYTLFPHSSKKIMAYQLWFWHIVIDDIDHEQQVIGVPGIKIHITKPKFVKHKYHCGHSFSDGL